MYFFYRFYGFICDFLEFPSVKIFQNFHSTSNPADYEFLIRKK